MKLLFQILTSFALACWPISVIISVMMFDAPGSTDNRKAIYMALVMVLMPMAFGILYYFLNQSFWGLKPKTFLMITLVVPIMASLLLGYPKLLLNNFMGISSVGYFVKGDKVYYNGALIKANTSNLEVLNEVNDYARTSDEVYFRGQRLEGADAKTFKSVAEDSSYFRDEKQVYFEGKAIPDSDSATFVRIEKEGQPTSYYKDKNSVYWSGRKINGLKSDSVKVLSGMYLVDADSVFYFQKKILGADPTSFRVFPEQETWGKDQKSVYFQDMAYPEIDPTTLEFLQRGYTKDKSKVYYYDGNTLKLVAEANAGTFKVTNWDKKTDSEATDGTNYFYQGKVVKHE